jgi:hypothetical protein
MAKRTKKISNDASGYNFFRTDLYKVFDSLSVLERKGLPKAADSKFLNENTGVSLLINWLLKESHKHAKSTGREVNREIAKAVFPKLKEDEAIKHLPSLRAKALKFLSEFIVLSACRNNPVLFQITWSNSLRKRGHWDLLGAAYKLLEKHLGASTNASVEDLAYAKLESQREQYRAFISQKNIHSPLKQSLSNYPEQLLHWFLSERLLQMFIPYVLEKELKYEMPDSGFEEEILNYIKSRQTKFPLDVQMLYHLLRSAQETEPKQKYVHAHSLLILWEKQASSLTTFQEYLVFHQLCHVFSQKILDEPEKMEGKGFLERILERIGEEGKSKFLEQMGGMPLRIYTNFITALSNQGRYEEAKKWTLDLSKLLKEGNRENARNLAGFIWLTKRGEVENLETAQEIFNSLSFQDDIYDCVVRAGMCKVYYHLEKNEPGRFEKKELARYKKEDLARLENEKLYHHLEAFRKFLSRLKKDKLYQTYFDKFMPFIKAVKSLLMYKARGNKVEASEIETFILGCNENLHEQKWLVSEGKKLIDGLSSEPSSAKASTAAIHRPQNFS